MSGDYSRNTFDPRRDFSGVLMQQGRVQLDADWNEMIDIISRRLRAGTTDIIGRGTVPKETPNGFKIEIAGGKLTIGRGRIYVDGLLAENHGKVPLEFDPVLAEQRGTLAVPYDEQPYYPNVAAIAPAPTEGGPYLLYLDVWPREVTYLENPDLIEKAVGVDTTTRLQTVWQVRVLAQIGANVTCDTPDDQVPGWADIIRPSDGRISTDAVGVAGDTDPCVIPPSGGYRGLENRLYRVEIHDGGIAGEATFKWSRDHASIATSVTAITALDKLTVARVGRDNTLRFNVGDWIEITDDWQEFAQQPGLMRQIKDVDDATQIITLTNALPAGTFPTNQGNPDPQRHTRIKRWDESGKITDTNGTLLVDLNALGSDGLIPVPPAGTSIVLEDGVQITFDTPGSGTYHVGDYWLFAARTADASVEKLVQAPPRGIHHHFCRLAMVKFPNPPTDCRHLWPPDFGEAGCDCSVCVTADSHNQGTLTIQKAIDQVKNIGGTVCLGVGVYNLSENSINIAGAKSLHLRGQGSETVLIYTGEGSAISIESSTDVSVERLVLLTAAREKTASPAVAVHNSSAVTLQRSAIFCMGVAPPRRNELTPVTSVAIGLGGILVGVLIRENFIAGAVGIGRMEITKAAIAITAAPDGALLTAGLVIEDNALECTLCGISFDGVSIHLFQTRLAGNLIVGCSQAGILMLGWVVPGSGLDVHENEINTAGHGIRLGTSDTRIESNNVAPLRGGQSGDGIILTLGLDRTGLDRCQILNNRILGMAGNGIHIVNGSIRSAMIKNNFIQAVGGGAIVMDDRSSAVQMTIENNQLLDLAAGANGDKTPAIGLRIIKTLRVEIISNAIVGVGIEAKGNLLRAGIQLINIGSGRVDGNEVINIGPAGDFAGDIVGIESLGTFSRLDIVNNTVRRDLVPPKTSGKSQWFAVRIAGSLRIKEFFVVSKSLSYFAVENLVYILGGDKLTALPRGKEIIGIQANLLEGHDAAPVVQVEASGALTFSTNRCLLKTSAGQPVARAQAGAIIASTNYLQGANERPALLLQLMPANGPFTVLGNISSGSILINGTLLTSPWAALNVIAP